MCASSNWSAVRTSTTQRARALLHARPGAESAGCASTPSLSSGPRLMSTTAWKFGGWGGSAARRALDEAVLVAPRAAARCGGARTRSWRRPSCPCPGPRTGSRRDARATPRRCRRGRAASRAGSGRSPRAPSSLSTARSGRAMSPTNSVSPVSTAHGSSPRAVSISANAVCSGRWPGVCSARTRTRPSSSSQPSSNGSWSIVRPRVAVDVDRRAGRRGEPAVAGDVVGVVVRLEDVLDRHAHVARQLQVLVDLELRVDDRREAGVLVADQVRGAAEVVVGELAEDQCDRRLYRRRHRGGSHADHFQQRR